MKLAVLGATGRTGQHLVRQALEQGHEVAVLARTPTKLTFQMIISTGAGVGDPGDNPRLFNNVMNILLKTAAKNVYEDMLKPLRWYARAIGTGQLCVSRC